MTEHDEPQVGPVLRVARDLREIETLHQQLEEQVEHKANDRLMPGGLAMAALGAVANQEAWLNRLATLERAGEDVSPLLEDHDDVWEPPLQTLLFWSEDWRRVHDSEFVTRPTVRTEAAFLRFVLDWAWDNEPRFHDFADDINQARCRLENLLCASRKPERTRVVCNRCEKAPRLMVFRGEQVDGSDDRWKCPNRDCGGRWFTADDVHRAHADMLRSKGAEKWIHQADAIGTLKAQGRPERTVRAWLLEGVGSGYCDPVTHEVWVWWPELWTKHLLTPTRNRASA